MAPPVRLDRDAAWGAALGMLVLAVFAPVWLSGRTPFWGDMTYLHHPWKTLPAQLLQTGRLPLWNPHIYFGMPMAASMQDGTFYPGTLPYLFFGFATASAAFHFLHFWLAAALTGLWLRSLRLSRAAALAGGIAVSLGGVFIGHMPFLNHLAVLSLAPGFLLFFRRPALLALTLSAAFLAGYPPFLLGAAAGAWALGLILRPRRRGLFAVSIGGWVLAGTLALTLSACLLLPAAELFANSRRSGGMDLAEVLNFGFAPKDLLQWVSPWLVASFDPAAEWWKASYLGLIGWGLALWGAAALGSRRLLELSAYLGAVLVLILGGTNPLSAWLWAHAAPLRFIRYPGNLAYLALPALALLVAAGVHRLPRRGLWLGALAIELLACARGSFPAAPRGLFTEAGPLVRGLQAELGGHRYLLSPKALERGSGTGILDWKFRLYGLTNAPFRLRAAGNFGEPLVPRLCYAFMDALYSRTSAQSAAGLFPWADIRLLLAAQPLPPSAILASGGTNLWEVYRFKGSVAGAYWFPPGAGEALPAGLPEPGREPVPGRALEVERPREDLASIAGDAEGPGWVYVSEPRYPGWRARLETPEGYALVPTFPALGAFQKVQVPPGPWRLEFRYDPASWKVGRFFSVISLMGFAAYWYLAAMYFLMPPGTMRFHAWYNRARRWHEA